ncbi:hypothetical protein OX284_006635 [Flavobacterium sp. SUN046]|uniref:hypothetical protein n=1 Tax=Flavobacterium sp. SUN046 TaxID=3002440 RepID=UPI002DBB0DE3|nr:hypothetical protein [Flavobacterium sp. SUN046]MEC4049099.1 hypothetical protein [Flavobacterium sp. SUN046]
MKAFYSFYIGLILTISNVQAQKKATDDSVPFKTAFKINLNGLRIGVEQRIFKKTTIQLELGGLSPNYTLINPQLRYYTKISKTDFVYVGLGYLYKHQRTIYNDSVGIVAPDGSFTNQKYNKDFLINKYIHAFTLNTGFFVDKTIFKQHIILEFNMGLGVRYKKSGRLGLNANEDIDFTEAYFIKPLKYMDTEGRFKIYPEINLQLSLVIPILK